MLEITKPATGKIAEYFKNKEVKPIRIFLHEDGCSIPYLAMDVDEIKDTDTVIDIDGFQFIVDEDLLREIVPIKIDYTISGFQFYCGLEFEDDEFSVCETCY